MIRTFLDAGVLITAARGTDEDASCALQVHNEFITTEKPNKSIYRTPSIPVISILDVISEF